MPAAGFFLPLFRPTPPISRRRRSAVASAPPPLAAARLHVEPPPPRPRARPAPPVRACASFCAACARAAAVCAAPLPHSRPRRHHASRARLRAPSTAVLHAFHAAAAAPRRSSSSTPQPHPQHPLARRSLSARQIACSRWVARREREKKLWSRSPLASGLVQRRRPRGPRWWPRPPRSRHLAVLVRSRSGRIPEAEAEAGAWAE